MSSRPRSSGASRRDRAHIFAALGDETRLALVFKLSDARSHSISQLAENSRLTRQAITKHLRVLENAGLVRCSRSGRESLFELAPAPIEDLKQYLELVSQHWDNALVRLKSFVED
jgi:DNA-binding transcriptional ArsR family regulator